MPEKVIYGGLFLVIIMLLAGCTADSKFSEPETVANGLDGAEMVEDSPGRLELVYSGPDPAPDSGNVYGRIMWNSVGAPEMELVLCTDFSFIIGCKDKAYSSQTDAEGYFLFTDVTPGVYALSVRIFNTDDWYTVNRSLFSSAEFVVEAGETVSAGIQNIFKLDLNVIYPLPSSMIDENVIKLDWDPYPDADYYKIYLTPDKGEVVLVNHRVDESEVTVELLPINCDYRWKIEAFNADRNKIAESGEYFSFAVAGQDYDCLLTLTAPVDGEILNGENMLLDWEPHVQALEYDILMWNDDNDSGENILNFVKVAESQLRLDFALEPGRHVWSVRAYDESGRLIAGSEPYDFLVED